MKKNMFLSSALFLYLAAGISCAGNSNADSDFTPPYVADDNDYPSDLPKPGEPAVYPEAISARNTYRPIQVKYASGVAPVKSWKEAPARLVAYLEGYERQISGYNDYKAITDEYGGCTTMGVHPATGRFYVKRIGTRWWIIDPKGNPYYMRGVASFRPGSSGRNKTAFASRFGDMATWVSTSRSELARIGFHQTAAFGTNGGYEAQLQHNEANPPAPFPLAPSFKFIQNFSTERNHPYADGDADNDVGLVLYDDWEEFCEAYLRSDAFAPYLGRSDVFGFFSDNEIGFSTKNYILRRFLDIADHDDIAYRTAVRFMNEHGTETVTEALEDEFTGMLAERYYRGVRRAIDKVDPGMLYLGSRLHGTPKYREQIIRAAGRYCDIVSINYYSRWSPEREWMLKWEQWADKPFIVTEFYTKGIEDSDLNNQSGSGFCVPTQRERAYAYQHFTLGLLEARNCVGWCFFKYQDDDGKDNDGKPSNKGFYDNAYRLFPYLSAMAREVNYNVYNLIEFFDGPQH